MKARSVNLVEAKSASIKAQEALTTEANNVVWGAIKASKSVWVPMKPAENPAKLCEMTRKSCVVPKQLARSCVVPELKKQNMRM